MNLTIVVIVLYAFGLLNFTFLGIMAALVTVFALLWWFQPWEAILCAVTIALLFTIY